MAKWQLSSSRSLSSPSSPLSSSSHPRTHWTRVADPSLCAKHCSTCLLIYVSHFGCLGEKKQEACDSMERKEILEAMRHDAVSTWDFRVTSSRMNPKTSHFIPTQLNHNREQMEKIAVKIGKYIAHQQAQAAKKSSSASHSHSRTSDDDDDDHDEEDEVAAANAVDKAFVGFLGQDRVVKQVKQSVKNRVSGFNRRNKALVLAFIGPSGTGKTEVAKRIARAIHGSGGNAKEKFETLPMAQYQDAKAIDNLIGPPIGIQGEGKLTGLLMQHPDAVVLLDEFEKAHPDAIPRVFLQAFDKDGSLKDTKSGKDVSTTQAIFIITSNVGDRQMLKMLEEMNVTTHEFTSESEDRAVKSALRETESAIASNPFKMSELRGRINDFIAFRPYSGVERRQIAEQALIAEAASLAQNAKRQLRIALGWDDGVVDVIASLYGGRDGSAGVRPILNAMNAVNGDVQRAFEKKLVSKDTGAFLTVFADDDNDDDTDGKPLVMKSSGLAGVYIVPVTNVSVVESVGDGDSSNDNDGGSVGGKKGVANKADESDGGGKDSSDSVVKGNSGATSGSSEEQVMVQIEPELALMTERDELIRAKVQREFEELLASQQQVLRKTQEELAVQTELVRHYQTQRNYLVAALAVMSIAMVLLAKVALAWLFSPIFLLAAVVMVVAALLALWFFFNTLFWRLVNFVWHMAWFFCQNPLLALLALGLLLVLWRLLKRHRKGDTKALRDRVQQLEAELAKQTKAIQETVSAEKARQKAKVLERLREQAVAMTEAAEKQRKDAVAAAVAKKDKEIELLRQGQTPAAKSSMTESPVVDETQVSPSPDPDWEIDVDSGVEDPSKLCD